MTVPEALSALLARDPSRPLVTHLGPEGARTELSVRTYENNVAKAANLLRDDADLQPGDAVALRLPLHWQTSIWLGACAFVSAVAAVGGAVGDAEVLVLGPDALDGPDGGRAPLTLATALHPLGMPFREPLPAGVLDAAVEVRSHGDRFTAYRPAAPGDAWLRVGGEELTQAAALAAARDLGARLGVTAGSRLLVVAGEGAAGEGAASPPGVLALLALPLVMDAAVVVLADPALDADVAAAREGCDAVLRVESG